MNNHPGSDKISNAAQIGGIETSVLDNGSGRGTRIAWINTGTGLRYKVVIDRAMDIMDAFYNQHSLSWLSATGVLPPAPFSNEGLNWLRTFGGGLLTTCGLSHFGPPETDAYGSRGLHGRVSNIPAEIESIMQPDPVNGKMEMSISGSIKETQIFGPSLELKRKISGTLGKAFIRIQDDVIRGNIITPHMMLYHCNLGWPLADEGTDIIWNGAWHAREGSNDKGILKKNHQIRKCPAPMEAHGGGGEDALFIDAVADGSGICTCGLHNPTLGIALAIRFNKKQLPWLTNWQHWGKGEYVTGLEPGTNQVIGQASARAQNELIFLKPGESRKYEIEFEILSDKKSIQDFIISNESK